MMRKVGNIDVQPMLEEIEESLWEPSGHGRQWEGTEVQTLIRHTEKPVEGSNLRPQYSPCRQDTPLDNLLLPGFRPTNVAFMYPETMKTLAWFATTYGGKYARAMHYRTLPGSGVGLHIDALPDKFGLNAPYDRLYRLHSHRSSDNKVLFYYKKDRFHIVIDGSFKYTVDCEEEDRVYEYPLTMTQPVTKVWSKGEIWWFNNKRPHTSYNHGDIPKINLVFDIEGATI